MLSILNYKYSVDTVACPGNHSTCLASSQTALQFLGFLTFQWFLSFPLFTLSFCCPSILDILSVLSVSDKGSPSISWIRPLSLSFTGTGSVAILLVTLSAVSLDLTHILQWSLVNLWNTMPALPLSFRVSLLVCVFQRYACAFNNQLSGNQLSFLGKYKHFSNYKNLICSSVVGWTESPVSVNL